MISREIRCTLVEPLRIGTGTPGLLSDDTVVHIGDGNGRQVPGVPAGTLKGAVRAVAASRWADLDDDVLRLAFGRSGSDPGIVLWPDLRPDADVEPVIEEVTSVALTERRTALRGALRTLEVVQPMGRAKDGGLVPLSLHGTVRVMPHERQDEVADAIVVGLAGLRSLGGGRSRGRGAVQMAIGPEVRA